MPDYSVIELLCGELGTTLAELMRGEEDEKSIHTYDNEQVVEMLGLSIGEMLTGVFLLGRYLARGVKKNGDV